MNIALNIWWCPKCGRELDTAGHCAWCSLCELLTRAVMAALAVLAAWGFLATN